MSGHHGVCVHLPVVAAIVTVSVSASHPITEDNHALVPENRPNSATLLSALVSSFSTVHAPYKRNIQGVKKNGMLLNTLKYILL